MAPDKAFVLRALLQHNYLPVQKKDREELPPIFKTTSFSIAAAKKLAGQGAKRRSPELGWDVVDYKSTKFNSIPRLLSIPHPTPHSFLSLCIEENWENLKYTAHNEISLVRPREHADGRLVIMDYDRSLKKITNSAKLAFGKRFAVHTDISNCFPSVYSHAIPWATVGFSHAKKNRAPTEWFNKLDKYIRWTKRNETQGIAIGPATSNIVSEAILARVDKKLATDGFEYVRYIDDYKAYCQSEDCAQEFIRKLADELAKFKLLLNIKKTSVNSLPQPTSDEWIVDLASSRPSRSTVEQYDAHDFLERAVLIARKNPEGSVLKYALKTLLSRKFELGVADSLLPRVLELTFHQPALLPLLERFFNRAFKTKRFLYGHSLHALASENSKLRRSDGMCWSLYYLNLYKVPVETELADSVLHTRDCLSLLLLYLSGLEAHRDWVIDFAKGLDWSDHYELDQYWILLYQLFLDGHIGNPYADEDAFEVLKSEGVNFTK
ncbi:MAG: RNA-directed DNA polymerase [Acidobacteriia bacterium]|nr:RNA-directed DNA polymerase [Terriglobia bacterium]